jgi:hypothetical protein
LIACGIEVRRFTTASYRRAHCIAIERVRAHDLCAWDLDVARGAGQHDHLVPDLGEERQQLKTDHAGTSGHQNSHHNLPLLGGVMTNHAVET